MLTFRCTTKLNPRVMDDVSLQAGEGVTTRLGEHSFDFGQVYQALVDKQAPADVWLYVRGESEDGKIVSVEFQETPFDDEKERAWNQMRYEAMVPKGVRDGVRSLRPYADLDRLIENTESHLYTREEYLSFRDAKPDAFDRAPHVEADTLAHARFFAYPVGVLVHVLENDTTYISAVNPTGMRSGFTFAVGFEEGDLDSYKSLGWSEFQKEDV